MKYFYLGIFALGFFFTGCVTNYKLEAIKKARVFAIKTFPDLDEAARHKVRFTTPQIRRDTILGQNGKACIQDFTQTCIIWDIEEKPGKPTSLVVVGFCEDDLKDWRPNRAFFKIYRYITEESKKIKVSDKK